jgi:hypothetical protein
MVIEYRIKRIDLIKVFFYNLYHSKRTQLVIFGLSILVFVVISSIDYSIQGNLTLYTLFRGFLGGFLFLLLLPLYIFITAKTKKRVLSINPSGIETNIGKESGLVSWEEVDSIVSTQDFIYITGKNTCVFTIPNNAFETEKEKTEFFKLASQYQSNLILTSRK